MKKTMSEYREISHAEQIGNPAFHNVHYPSHMADDTEIMRPAQQLFNGVLVRSGENAVWSPVENFRKYKASDFALENIIAAGAVDMLRQCNVKYGTGAELSDSVGESVDRLFDAIDAENNNVENPND